MTLTRRVFLKWSAAVSAWLGTPRRSAAAPARGAQPRAPGLGPRELGPLAEAVLPAELGAAGIERATNEFAAWIAGYPDHAELLHPYGSDRIGHTAPSPVARWTQQLADLDAAARAAHGRPFGACTISQRTALVAAAVDPLQRGTRVPGVAGAPHVALALLAHFLDSPAATNLAYERAIDPRQCRPLAASPQIPAPIRRGSGAGASQ
ncbi:MAG: hypothetical protein U9Q74_01640 [Gemmatimonadota bacterium]|nr:hypothetical protein [Gemmatimonadota bacterium]